MIASFQKAMKRYAIHMAAVIAIVVIAMSVATYLLSHQRFYLPGWVPVIGTSFYTISGDFETAQAVTPGQGQTVNIAGVPVGEIGNVSLKDGHAVVQMKIRKSHAPVYKNATLLLRPKTPLSDMYIDMTPGTKSAGAIPPGGEIPLSHTQPTVNFDEFLSVLDDDTRNYFQLLLNGAGQGLKGRGADLRAGFKRFAPTGKYGVQIVKELQLRRKNLKRAIHNLALLSKQLGDNSAQFASLIDSSSTTFHTWASQQESIREIIQKSPSALGETADASKAAQQVVADSAVAFKDLEPLGTNLGTSLQSFKKFFNDQTPVTRDQFRPLARDAQPLLQQLNPAASGLAKLAPDATAATKSFNDLLNIVAYNPKGSDEGYLYWLSWFSHLNASTFSREDANGPLQSGAILGTCSDFSTAAATKGVVGKTGQVTPGNGNDMLSLIYGLTGLPGACT